MANAIVLSGFLPPQHFTGNPLDRHSDLLKRFQATYNPDSEVSLIVVTGRDVVVRPVGPDSTPGVHQDLQALLLRTDDPELDLQGEQLLLKWTPSEYVWAAVNSATQVLTALLPLVWSDVRHDASVSTDCWHPLQQVQQLQDVQRGNLRQL
jgi:hypothetical protein